MATKRIPSVDKAKEVEKQEEQESPHGLGENEEERKKGLKRTIDGEGKNRFIVVN